MQLKRRMFEGQFDPGQSLLVLSWPLHAEYRISPDSMIEGEGYGGRSYEPLEDPDLFPSFARLGAHGQPAEESILRWVKEHGLLQGYLRKGVSQRAMTVDEFREEVRCAREVAALYIDIQEKNSKAIWARFVGDGEYQESWKHNNPVDKDFAEWHQSEHFESFRRSLEPPEHPDHLKSGAVAFERILKELIGEVTLQPLSDDFLVDDEGTMHLHSWEPHEPYRPILSWDCPDLRSAIYLQFALMVTGGKPWRRCANPHCRSPFPAKPSNKVFCKRGCRSTGRNYPH